MLRRYFENIFMKYFESMEDFFTQVMGLVNQIRSYGDTVTDQKIVEKMLRIFPFKFDHIVIAIEESKDLKSLSINELMGSLQTHEKRMNRSTNFY